MRGSRLQTTDFGMDNDSFGRARVRCSAKVGLGSCSVNLYDFHLGDERYEQASQV
jgi:hypothetical protein